MKAEVLEMCVNACEKHTTNNENAAKMIKELVRNQEQQPTVFFKDFKSALLVDRQCFFWSWSANMHSFHPSGSIL
jgi:hypothetical protein